jgi:fumarate reductase subunit D
MPSASYTSSGGEWIAILLPLWLLALVVVIPLVLTRALAIALAKVART